MDVGAKNARGYAHKYTGDLVKPCQLCQLLPSAKGSKTSCGPARHGVCRYRKWCNSSLAEPWQPDHNRTRQHRDIFGIRTHTNLEHITSPVHPFGSTHATAHESKRQGPTCAASADVCQSTTQNAVEGGGARAQMTDKDKWIGSTIPSPFVGTRSVAKQDPFPYPHPLPAPTRNKTPPVTWNTSAMQRHALQRTPLISEAIDITPKTEPS